MPWTYLPRPMTAEPVRSVIVPHDHRVDDIPMSVISNLHRLSSGQHVGLRVKCSDMQTLR
jgi:hypothetical protein